jgi:GMP synthase (glutamine-hydrolysing)
VLRKARRKGSKTCSANFPYSLGYVDAADRFLDKLAGVEDPERKRKIIGHESSRYSMMRPTRYRM